MSTSSVAPGMMAGPSPVKRMILAALSLIGFFVALYLTLFKLGVIGELTCSIGGCEKVNSSKWAELFGIPVAAWGLGFYVSAFVVSFAGTLSRFVADRRVSLLLLVMTGIGVLFSAWLTYLELYVIHAICQYCVVSAVIVTVMFIVTLLDWREQRRFTA